MSGHVFISYNHASDADYVERLAAYLAAAGVVVWFDREMISGDRWDDVIEERIATCSAFIIVMSPDAKASPWVKREINQAEKLGKPILPLLLKGEVFFRLSDLQYEDVTGGRMPSDAYTGRLPAAPLPPTQETVPAQVPVPAREPVPARAPAADVSPLAARVKAYLDGMTSSQRFHVAPDIPAAQLANARTAHNLPADEEIFALYDFTFWGGAKESMLFTSAGLRYRNINVAGAADLQFDYDAFANGGFELVGARYFLFGDGKRRGAAHFGSVDVQPIRRLFHEIEVMAGRKTL